MTDRPNFLYIITDQHRADWLGCAGHPVVKTPNIDALAARSTRFTDFHTASPVCMPNRASLMTGRMPSQHGLRYNGCVLPPRANTFADVLSAAGYDTALIGKSHLQPFTGQKPMHLPDPDAQPPRRIEEAWKPEGADTSHELSQHYAGTDRYDIPLPFYGFSHVDIVTQHGDRCAGHYAQWLRAERPDDWEALWDDAGELPQDYTCPQAYRTQVPEELYPTTWVADRAIDYLEDATRDAKPFFAFVSFPDPHHPFNPPGKYWDMYDPDDFEVDLPFEAHENPPPHLAWLRDSGGSQVTKQTVTRLSHRHLKEAMALTAGMITMIDDQVGRIIDTLKARGLYENTVIVFNSDHGDYLGDFNLILKGALQLPSITRVPMIWSDPARRAATETATLASTVDIAATILDRAGLTPYRGMAGRSFLPTILDDAPHRREVLIEYNDGAAKLGFDTPARARTLRSDRWRLTLYAGEDWGELYDLRADPRETRNLWDDPAHHGTRGDLTLRLAHLLAQQMDESPRSEWIA